MAKEVKPAFKIGDHVVFKGTTGRKKKLLDRWFDTKKAPEEIAIPAQVFRVTDHVVETCYGGVQVHYVLRGLGIGADGYGFSHNAAIGVEREMTKAREVELEAAPEGV